MGGGSVPSITFSPCTSHPTSRCSSQMPARRLKFESLRACYSTLKASLGRSFACGSGFRLKAPARLRPRSRLLALDKARRLSQADTRLPFKCLSVRLGQSPGPGVSMALGRNAAQVIFADLGLDFQEGCLAGGWGSGRAPAQILGEDVARCL